jgi:hypothetical protein
VVANDRPLTAGWLTTSVLAALLAPAPAYPQNTTAEADVTVGASTDESTTASTQVRLFGASKSDWRYYLEGTWGAIGSEYSSDAFASAYPYDQRIRAMEMFGEKTIHPRASLLGVRGGRYRTPFGISARSDHAYSGFLRAPLVRYGRNFALSNTFLETGADLVIGAPALYVETSLGIPQDQGAAQRRRGLDEVVRAQGYFRDLIIGTSYLRANPSDPRSFAVGRMVFRGLDARWMRSGVELRGEWIDGRPFDGVVTRGGYLDAIIHEAGMGPVTAVARIERLDYDAGPFSEHPKRLTVGARLRLTSWVAGQINFVRQPLGLGEGRNQALDVAFTFSKRFSH